MNEEKWNKYLDKVFGVDLEVFYLALEESVSARGYIHGAIAEVLLTKSLEDSGFEWIRIKEKPSGGFNAKSAEARGDFYIREKDSQNEYFVIECKGVKTNAEKHAGLNTQDKVFKYLKKFAFPADDSITKRYDGGLKKYQSKKAEWEGQNPGKTFPDFNWPKDYPGCDSVDLTGLWPDVKSLKEWVFSYSEDDFSEDAYWNCTAPIALLQTHMPSVRVAPITEIKQAGPLTIDFNILAVDLFLRTGKHEFVFMNPEKISHSPTSPEHLYQNYTIDVLIKEKKPGTTIVPPWYSSIHDCISATNPPRRQLDESQIDSR
ncbi:MAG: hypothetical protein JW763_00485 [candidate division Zixibacteria bacterium]|nr:hypothetical protein [candidate division Zixibacteria bacterium]